MEHELGVGDEGTEVEIVEVRLDEPEPRVLQAPQVLPLHLRVVVVGQHVHADHVVVVGKQPGGERAADEPGDAGHERDHEAPPSAGRTDAVGKKTSCTTRGALSSATASATLVRSR